MPGSWRVKLSLNIAAIAQVFLRLRGLRGVPWTPTLIRFAVERIAVIGAVVLLNIDLSPASAAPTLNNASVTVEQDLIGRVQEDTSGADLEHAENIQRINRALIEYGRLQGLTLRGYENEALTGSDTFDDPHLVTLLLAQREGSGVHETTTSLSEPYVYSAMMLANIGFLSGGDNLYSGPSSNDARLALVEQVMKVMNKTGPIYVDPIKVYAKLYQQVQKTDPNDMTTGEDDPGFPYNQIAITNSALVTGTAFMSEDGQRWLVDRLNNAADEFMLALATGETSMSYPEYLQSIGASDWFEG